MAYTNCLLTQGFVKDCRDSVGGIKTIYLANKHLIDSITSADGEITAITMDTGANFYKYELRRQTSNFTETIEASEENGTVFFEQEANIMLTKMEAAKRNEIYLIAKADTVMVVEDQNGKQWMLGKEHGLTLTGTAETGTAFGDMNGYNLTFTGQEREPAMEVSGSIIEGLLE